MELNLKLKENPFLFSLTNEDGNEIFIDAAESIGGTKKGFRPMQLLAGSLASCISIDLISILRKKKIQVEDYEVKILGKRKASGTSTPFEEINLVFYIKPTISKEVVEKAANLVVDKYCSVAASLNSKINIKIEIKA
jgi:putative redox protein